MALNISIWQNTLVENFYPDNSFASKSVDDSTYVSAKKVVIPNAGKPSNVKKNRPVKPAQVNQRADDDLEYVIDELTTDPIYIPNIDTVELSYDKRSSIISNDRTQLQNEAHLNLLERWGAGVPAANVLLTTGTTERAARTSETATWMFQNSADMQRGVLGNLYGLNIMKRSKVLRVKNDKTLLSWEEDAVAGELAAALAWHDKSVSRALGEVKMFGSTDDPMYYGDIYSFLLRTGGSVRRYDKKGVYLLAEAAK